MRALAGMLLSVAVAAAQPAPQLPPDVTMPAYTLPPLLKTTTGRDVRSAEQWHTERRPELLELFRTHVYGRVPDSKYTQKFTIVREDAAALGGKATLKEVDITIERDGKPLVIRLRLFIPRGVSEPVPAFLLINNRGPEVVDVTRQKQSDFWPVEAGIARGFAMAAFLNSDVDPDRDDGFQDGIHGLLDAGPRGDDAWGTLAAWAWGASRCLDYLLTEPGIKKDGVAVIGHSRGGKTALWAGAEDERFAMVISNNSGCGGAALNRRRFQGREQVARINTAFPHWFCRRFHGYGNREDDLPVDQHQLLALSAPRLVAVGSAAEDRWADPRGEFLSVVHSEPAFKLLGKNGLGTHKLPAIGQSIHGDGLHYHLRAGKHNLLLEDWNAYWDFADREWRPAR